MRTGARVVPLARNSLPAGINRAVGAGWEYASEPQWCQGVSRTITNWMYE